MSRNTGSRPSAPAKSGNSLLVGVLIGALVGVGMAAGVVWYLKNSPSPFIIRGQKPLAQPTESAKPAPQSTAAASGVASGKPRFEFYKVLTDKQDATLSAPPKPADKPKAAAGKSVPAYEPQILQAGAFSNETEAEKLKAKLALLGIEAGIQTATIPDKGVWYRVRLGPYKSMEEINRARSFLKQNGVESTPMRAP